MSKSTCMSPPNLKPSLKRQVKPVLVPQNGYKCRVVNLSAVEFFKPHSVDGLRMSGKVSGVSVQVSGNDACLPNLTDLNVVKFKILTPDTRHLKPVIKRCSIK